MKRFITYFYEYTNGQKGKNVGFARLDIRDETARLQLNLQGGHKTQSGELYLVIHKEGQAPMGIFFGMTEGSSRKSGWTFSGLKIKESPYGVEDVVGVGIRFPSGQYAASCWSDEPPRELLEGSYEVWKKPELRSETISSNYGGKENSTVEETSGRKEMRAAGSDRKEHSIYQASVRQESLAETEADGTKKSADKAKVNQGRSIAATEADGEEKSADKAKVDQGRLMATQADERKKSPDKAGANQENSMATEADEREKRPGNLMESGAKESGNPSRKQVENRCESELSENIKEKSESENHKKDYTCRRIDIGEINKLPLRNRYLINNSFLLHGFFNYHYLVLLEREEASGGRLNQHRIMRKRTYLGVPGIFEQSERAMALLFGFTNFVPDEDKAGSPESGLGAAETTSFQPEPGTFGYWCCPIG